MREEVLSTLLTANNELSRDEPQVAANIGAQLEHMGLSTWSISVRRRIRDAISRIEPKNVIEIGSGIGHLSAWLMDHFESNTSPEIFQMVEEGNRFAVILTRLKDRYSSVNSKVIVGKTAILAGETKAWKLSGGIVGEPPLKENADAIIVNSQLDRIASDIESMLPLMSKNGVLLTVEPIPPVGDRAEDDPEVVGFNKWMELIKSTTENYHIAFMPIFGGTIVAWLSKD